MPSRALRLVSALAFLAAAIAACKTAELAAQGGACSLATDCQPGLVCIGKQDGTRTCESDLSSVTNPVPPNMRDGGEGGAVEADGATPVPPPNDAETPDTATPPVDAAPDTAAPVDAAAG